MRALRAGQQGIIIGTRRLRVEIYKPLERLNQEKKEKAKRPDDDLVKSKSDSLVSRPRSELTGLKETDRDRYRYGNDDNVLERSLSPDGDRRYPDDYRAKMRDLDLERRRDSSPGERGRYKEPYRFRAREDAFAYEQEYRARKDISRDLKYRRSEDYERGHHRYSPGPDSSPEYRRLHEYERLRRYRSDMHPVDREERRLKDQDYYDEKSRMLARHYESSGRYYRRRSTSKGSERSHSPYRREEERYYMMKYGRVDRTRSFRDLESD